MTKPDHPHLPDFGRTIQEKPNSDVSNRELLARIKSLEWRMALMDANGNPDLIDQVNTRVKHLEDQFTQVGTIVTGYKAQIDALKALQTVTDATQYQARLQAIIDDMDAHSTSYDQVIAANTAAPVLPNVPVPPGAPPTPPAADPNAAPASGGTAPATNSPSA